MYLKGKSCIYAHRPTFPCGIKPVFSPRGLEEATPFVCLLQGLTCRRAKIGLKGVPPGHPRKQILGSAAIGISRVKQGLGNHVLVAGEVINRMSVRAV